MYSWKHRLRGAVACAVIAASSMTAFAGAPSYLEQVDPQLRPALEQNSSLDFNQAGVLEDINRRARSLVGSPDLPKDEAVHVYDVYIPRAGDSETLRLRIYKPVQAEASLPGIYWIHGGGFLFGVPEPRAYALLKTSGLSSCLSIIGWLRNIPIRRRLTTRTQG